MTIAGDRDKYPTQDEREPSDCAKRTERGKGGRRKLQGHFWAGMNDRDETDEATKQPIGRMLAEGFRLLDDCDIADEE